MKLQPLSMERIRELDKIWDRECDECLRLGSNYRAPSPFFLHERFGGINFAAMAKKWNVSLEHLKTYVCLQRYINDVANGKVENLPDKEYMAEMLGVSLEDFVQYLQEKIDIFKEAWTPDEDDFTGDGPYPIAWKDFEDLQQDAALQQK